MHKCKVPDERGKGKVWRVCRLVLGSRAKPSPLKQSVGFKCQMRLVDGTSQCSESVNFYLKR